MLQIISFLSEVIITLGATPLIPVFSLFQLNLNIENDFLIVKELRKPNISAIFDHFSWRRFSPCKLLNIIVFRPLDDFVSLVP